MIIDGVFSGGGIKGFAYVGAIQVLEERGIQGRYKRHIYVGAGISWRKRNQIE